MNNYKLSKRSKDRLIGVHPDLIKVVTTAITITPLDFGVSCGLREVSEQEQLFKNGASTTMDSMHLPQWDGYSHAVDLFVLVNNEVTWDHKHFRKVVQAVFTSAIYHSVQIEAGALWRDFIDSPHIQLNQLYYGYDTRVKKPLGQLIKNEKEIKSWELERTE